MIVGDLDDPDDDAEGARRKCSHCVPNLIGVAVQTTIKAESIGHRTRRLEFCISFITNPNRHGEDLVILGVGISTRDCKLARVALFRL